MSQLQLHIHQHRLFSIQLTAKRQAARPQQRVQEHLAVPSCLQLLCSAVFTHSALAIVTHYLCDLTHTHMPQRTAFIL